MLNYKIMLKYTIIWNYGIIKIKWNYTIMLIYTLSMMCMNNIKNDIKYTNILCRINLLCIFSNFWVFVEVCNACLLTSY